VKRRKLKPAPRKFLDTRPFIIIGVLLLVTATLVLKARGTSQDSASGQEQVEVIPTAAQEGVATAPVAELGRSPATAPTGAAASMPLSPTQSPLPEEQLDQFLTSGRPILAFFHSDTCVQCVRMTEIVGQVYPEFAGRVALVDVNVYDRRNQNLLGRARIQVIPTLVFIDRLGQGQGYTGVMPAEQLREQLAVLAEES
jgi:thiol-disulfide isomerase/thioredoxin